MFTGIVERVGKVASVNGGTLWVDCGSLARQVALGGSIAVEGVCLTATRKKEKQLRFDLADETLERTTLDRLKAGGSVNLELPLRMGQPLGGHLVQGHVDGVGRIVAVQPQRVGRRIRITAPASFRRWIVEKGSIAVDGVSLTIASVKRSKRALEFSVALIPHTLKSTTLGARRPGDPVNLEADVFLKWAASARK